jgi:hypothetical protein
MVKIRGSFLALEAPDQHSKEEDLNGKGEI